MKGADEESMEATSRDAEDTRQTVFLDSTVLLTAVSCEQSDSACLLQRCEDGTFLGVISNKVLEECCNKVQNRPEYRNRLANIAKHLRMVLVTDQDLECHTKIADPDDRHVLAGALAANADYIATLDWKHFLSPSAKARLKEYPIPRVFPGVLVSSFRYGQLPRVSIGITEGTLSIAVDPSWTSQSIQGAGCPFYLLDFPNVFSVWYEPQRFRIKMRTEVYDRPATVTYARYIDEGDGFICIVTWDVARGFAFLLDGKLQRIPRRWHKIPTGGNLYVASDRHGANQINGLVCFHGWPRALSEKEMMRVFEGGYVLLPEKPASL